jgi:hypothetical protein
MICPRCGCQDHELWECYRKELSEIKALLREVLDNWRYVGWGYNPEIKRKVEEYLVGREEKDWANE